MREVEQLNAELGKKESFRDLLKLKLKGETNEHTPRALALLPEINDVRSVASIGVDTL